MHPELRSWVRKSNLTLAAIGLLFSTPFVGIVLSGEAFRPNGRKLVAMGVLLAVIFGLVGWFKSKSTAWLRTLSAEILHTQPVPALLLELATVSEGRGRATEAIVSLSNGSKRRRRLLDHNVRHARRTLKESGSVEIQLWSGAEGPTAFTLPDGRLLAFRPPPEGYAESPGSTRAFLMPLVVYAVLVAGSALWHQLLAKRLDRYLETGEGMALALKLGQDPNGVDDGVPLLHREIRAGRQDVVEALLAANADPEARDRSGRSALALAAHKGSVEIATVLLQHRADPNGGGGEAPLAEALASRHPEVIRLLLDHGADATTLEVDDETRSQYKQLARRDPDTWKYLAQKMGRELPGPEEDPPPPFPDYVRAPSFDAPGVLLPPSAKVSAARSTGLADSGRKEDRVTFLTTASIDDVAAFYLRTVPAAGREGEGAGTTINAAWTEGAYRQSLRLTLSRSADGETTKGVLHQLRE